MILLQPWKFFNFWDMGFSLLIHGSKRCLLYNSKSRFSCSNNILGEVVSSSLQRRSLYQNENGMVTAVALLLIAALTLLGTAAVVTTSTDILIGGNYKVSEVAFYAAEAGAEEARARLRSTAGANRIDDNLYQTDTAWRAYIGDPKIAQEANERCLGCVGYNSDDAKHSITLSLQDAMSYVVEIKHRTDAAGNIMYWGDHDKNGTMTRNTDAGNSNNRNIYLVTSSGYTGNSIRTVEAEITKVAPIPVPSPLYVEAPATIQGSSTYISGNDACGSEDKHGIITTLSTDTITIPGQSKPTIAGVGDPYGDPPKDIFQADYNLDIAAMVGSFKDLANFSYNGSNPSILEGTNWGQPQSGETQQDPSTCSDHNIVYFNTGGGTIKLGGQPPSGCGILLVEGNLRVDGNFAWNGIILVTGSITFAGGGNKQVTGGILSGGTVDADLIGGNASIVYCSSAVKDQTESLPLRSLSWRDLRQGN